MLYWQHGHQLHYVDVTLDPLDTPQIQQTDLLIVLGGPIGAYDEQASQFCKVNWRQYASASGRRPDAVNLPGPPAYCPRPRRTGLSAGRQGNRFQPPDPDCGSPVIAAGVTS